LDVDRSVVICFEALAHPQDFNLEMRVNTRRANQLILAAVVGVFACDGVTSGLGQGSTPGVNGQPSNPGQPGPGQPVNPDQPYDPNMPLPPSSAGPVIPSEAVVRRLTKLEFLNTLKDSLGVNTDGLSFPDDGIAPNGFEKGLSNRVVSLGEAQQFLDVVEQVAFQRMDVNKVAGCTLAISNAEACVTAYLNGKAWTLFRRPLTADETVKYAAVARKVVTEKSDAPLGFRTMVATMLMSPHFQYRTEFGAGQGEPSQSRTVVLSQFEIASALSYLLLNSIPDEALFQAAKNGQLSTPAEVGAQVARLLSLEKAGAFVDIFAANFMSYLDPDELYKDPTAYPNFTPAVARSLQKETSRLFRDVFLNSQGTYQQLLTTPNGYATKATAAIYGLDPASLTDQLSKVTFDSSQRAGFLTQPGLISSKTTSELTSPIHMGYFILTELLCNNLGIVPEDALEVNSTLPLPPNPNNRDFFEARMSKPKCAGCHRSLEPPGLTFDQYDVIGKVRNPPPFDLSGELLGSDQDGPFKSPVELIQKLAASSQVHACLGKSLMRYVYGRLPDATKDTFVDPTANAFLPQQQGNIQQLLKTLISHPAFVTRQVSL
jgi:Protein of unknown function (DUF1592)/Protein of unknown function (DUF1588)/Protein of unknown function (DUF1595)/Protein of unknown function (DUF1587)